MNKETETVNEDHEDNSNKITIQEVTNQIVEEMVLNLNKKVIKKDMMLDLKKDY